METIERIKIECIEEIKELEAMNNQNEEILRFKFNKVKEEYDLFETESRKIMMALKQENRICRRENSELEAQNRYKDLTIEAQREQMLEMKEERVELMKVIDLQQEQFRQAQDKIE